MRGSQAEHASVEQNSSSRSPGLIMHSQVHTVVRDDVNVRVQAVRSFESMAECFLMKVICPVPNAPDQGAINICGSNRNVFEQFQSQIPPFLTADQV